MPRSGTHRERVSRRRAAKYAGGWTNVRPVAPLHVVDQLEVVERDSRVQSVVFFFACVRSNQTGCENKSAQVELGRSSIVVKFALSLRL